MTTALPREKTTHVSASQVVAFLRCNRYWYAKTQLKLPEPRKEAADKGGRIHKIVEYFLKSGLLSQPPGSTDEDLEIARAAIAVLPARSSELLIEHKFELLTYPGGPGWLGYIDFIDAGPSRVVVGDHKTRSDFRYCSKPEDLLKDPQMISYARFALDHFRRGEVDVVHKYVCTKGTGRGVKTYKTLEVSAVANRKQVEHVWAELMPVVQAMVSLRDAEAIAFDDIAPNTASCGAFGGCAYRTNCGYAAPAPKLINIPQKVITMSETPNGETRKLSLSEKLALKKANTAATVPQVAAPAPAAAPVAKGPSPAEVKAQNEARMAKARAARGVAASPIVPPDAPPNEVAAVEEIEPTPPPPPRRIKVPAVAARPQEQAPLVPPKPAKSEPEPVWLTAEEAHEAKEQAERIFREESGEAGYARAFAMLREELASMGESPRWNAVFEGAVLAELETLKAAAKPAPAAPAKPVAAKPAKRTLCIFVDCMPVKGSPGDHVLFEDWVAPYLAEITEENGVADYRMIAFGGWKPFLAQKVRDNVLTLPEVLVMSSYGPGVQEALDALTPHATMIVKKLG